MSLSSPFISLSSPRCRTDRSFSKGASAISVARSARRPPPRGRRRRSTHERPSSHWFLIRAGECWGTPSRTGESPCEPAHPCFCCSPQAALRQDDAAVRPAIEKGLKRIEAGVKNYPTHRNCFSCHHQAMAVLSMIVGPARAASPSTSAVSSTQVDFSLQDLSATSRRSPKGRASAATAPPSSTPCTPSPPPTARTTTRGRPWSTICSSSSARTALADRRVRRPPADDGQPVHQHRPGDVRAEDYCSTRGVTTRGAAALRSASTPPSRRAATGCWPTSRPSTEDKVFHLRGLVDCGRRRQGDRSRARGLLKEQRDDGSWAQLAQHGTAMPTPPRRCWWLLHAGA